MHRKSSRIRSSGFAQRETGGAFVQPAAGLSHLPDELQRQPEPKPNKFESGLDFARIGIASDQLVIDLVRETVTPY